ncbi:RNA methyltransferase [Spirochaetia bacterium]|nr:RNA methyltransferase [Spirochaetia bacterium]
MTLSDIVIILSRPSESGNVGAVCRAMKNMGLSRLRIAGVSRESLNEATIRARAVHAADVWEGAAFFDTLAEAAADCSLLVGTTRRRGHHRKNVTMDPKELAAWLRDRPGQTDSGPTADFTALVFGNERTGLEDDELALCNIASHIPVSDAFPSLNLSHAVQIYAYELFQALGSAADEPVKGAWVPLSREQADALTAAVTENLEALGFYRHPGRAEQERFIRDFISRAGLTKEEGRYFGDIFAKAARLARGHT